MKVTPYAVEEPEPEPVTKCAACGHALPFGWAMDRCSGCLCNDPSYFEGGATIRVESCDGMPKTLGGRFELLKSLAFPEDDTPPLISPEDFVRLAEMAPAPDSTPATVSVVTPGEGTPAAKATCAWCGLAALGHAAWCPIKPSPPKPALPSVEALAWALFRTDTEVAAHVRAVGDYAANEGDNYFLDCARYGRAYRIAWERDEPDRARSRCEAQVRLLLERLAVEEEPSR